MRNKTTKCIKRTDDEWDRRGSQVERTGEASGATWCYDRSIIVSGPIECVVITEKREIFVVVVIGRVVRVRRE